MAAKSLAREIIRESVQIFFFKGMRETERSAQNWEFSVKGTCKWVRKKKYKRGG